MSRRIGLALSLLTAMILLLSFAQARALPALNDQERLEWIAVGVVNATGNQGASSCSGTLVAPDLVVTAAHCTTKKEGLMAGVHFTAGRDGTRFIADSGSLEALRYPVWEFASGASKYRFDLAVIRLSRRIPGDKVRPVRLVPKADALPETGALLGYRNAPKTGLHGRFDCPLSTASLIGVITSDCEVTSGNSGGAVLVRGAQGWQLAGVIVARREPQGTALAVEVNDWLRAEVEAAWEREAQRSAAAGE